MFLQLCVRLKRWLAGHQIKSRQIFLQDEAESAEPHRHRLSESD